MKMINKKIWTLTLVCTMILSMSTMVSQVKAEDPIPPPSLSYSYNDISNTLTITSVDSGYYYAEGASFTQANIAFSGEGISLFILENYSVGTQGIGDADLITNEIQAGDVLSGFPAGTYNIIWMPTAEVIGTVTFTDWSAEASPSYIPLGKTSSVVISVSEAAGSSNDGVYVRLHGCGVNLNTLTDSNGDASFSVSPSTTGTISIDVGSYGDTVSEVITVTAIQEAPSLSYYVNDELDTLTIAAVSSGFYYNDGTSFGQANLVFDGDGVTLFVLNGYVVGTQGLGDNDCLTSMIQAGDILSGFSAGTYNIVWSPTAEVIGTVTFTEEIITPQISFIADENDNTITVTSMNSSNVLWSDVEVSGNCSTSGLGTYVTPGDQIVYCNGYVYLTYVPTGEFLFGYTFSSSVVTPQISFVANDNSDTITIAAVDQSDVLWSDIEVSGSCSTSGLGTYVTPGDQIVYCNGYISLMYTPTDTLLFGYTFSSGLVTPQISFIADENDNTITVTSMNSSNVLWSNIDIYGNCSTTYLGMYVEVGDQIRYCNGYISLTYIPTDALLFDHTFAIDPFTPLIYFTSNDNTNTITVVSVSKLNVLWSNIDIYGNCSKKDLDTTVSPGDQIIYCFGTITLTYIPTNKLIAIFDFSNPIPVGNRGWVYGMVYEESGNDLQPISDAQVFYRPYTSDNTSYCNDLKAKYVNENSSYVIELPPGIYLVSAGKKRPGTTEKIVKIITNERVEQNFVINGTVVENPNIPTFNPSVIQKVKDAIKIGNVGGVITIWQGKNKQFVDNEVIVYDAISITAFSIEDNILSFNVSGDENSAGKTIAIATSLDIFDLTKDFVVEYDGEILNMADNTNDVLNPNDDGLHAEYLITIGTDGVEILISIPHFSEHEIIISTLELKGAVEDLVESVGGPEAAMFYVSICVIASVLFIGTIYIRRRF